MATVSITSRFDAKPRGTIKVGVTFGLLTLVHPDTRRRQPRWFCRCSACNRHKLVRSDNLQHTTGCQSCSQKRRWLASTQHR
jgi:hypothetical protein